jgi:hypothetical protein
MLRSATIIQPNVARSSVMKMRRRLPLFATYDKKSSDSAKLFFYDAMGAQFDATDFASSGSGAAAVIKIVTEAGVETVSDDKLSVVPNSVA